MAKPGGAFLPTTNVWDVSEIYSTDVNSDEFKELLVRLYQNMNNVALAVNAKDTGAYENENEFVTGQNFFSNPTLTSTSSTTPTKRPVFRKVINFGVLPNAAATGSVAHGLTITDQYTFTRIYGAASDITGGSYVPLPYASATAADVIELDVDATNVNITVGKDQSAYATAYIVLEYIKN